MRRGREKCEILKAIRAYVADRYGVDYAPSECHHDGDCHGTCPKCDAELDELQERLEEKGVSDLSKDAKLCEMVENYLSQCAEEDGHSFTAHDDLVTEGLHVPVLQGLVKEPAIELQGDIRMEPEDFETEGNVLRASDDDRKLFKECSVAGTSFHNVDDIWDMLKVGTKLALVRERGNAYDKNAVAVALADDYEEDPDDFDSDLILGYVPRKDNESLAAMLDMGWAEVFETEISELKEHAPYSDRIHISIYIKNKENNTVEPVKGNRLRIMVFRDEERWTWLSDELWQKGYVLFRWGGFPPWELDLPGKGDKVVFAYYDEPAIHLYLMQTIAVDGDAAPFVENLDELFKIDDCTAYVLTNVVGPITLGSEELKLPQELLRRYSQPDGQLPQDLSNRLMELFEKRQFSDNVRGENR